MGRRSRSSKRAAQRIARSASCPGHSDHSLPPDREVRGVHALSRADPEFPRVTVPADAQDAWSRNSAEAEHRSLVPGQPGSVPDRGDGQHRIPRTRHVHMDSGRRPGDEVLRAPTRPSKVRFMVPEQRAGVSHILFEASADADPADDRDRARAGRSTGRRPARR